MTAVLFACAAAYLAGGFPTAYIAGKLFKGIDIRRHGSGNVGATNAVRVLGRKIGAWVFAVDFLKGWGPVFLATLFIPEHELVMIAVGISAILGHVFTPYLGFKGGKGVATGAGALFGLYPTVFFAALAVWLLVFAVSRVVSISSIAAAASLPIASFFFGQSPVAVSTMTLLFAFMLWNHRSNIARLRKGDGA